MKNMNIRSKEIIHFIGIGGIGMSGLAQIMKIMNFNIQGSDLDKNKNTENCKKKGIKIFYGHLKKNISRATIVVKSNAIKQNNVEIKEAKRKKIPIFERAEMLSNIVSLKKNIIISGSHGKTTTTSLVAKILLESKLDPTIINGGVINSIKNNAKFGKGDWTVLEADESDGSFLKLPVNYSIVTNIDNEHLDFYKSFENLEKSFIKFINKTPPIGKSFICIDDKNIQKIIKKLKTKNYLTYGFNKKADYQIFNARYKTHQTIFNLKIKKINKKTDTLKNIKINLIGSYNVQNTAAAVSICLKLGLKQNTIKKALSNFSGVQRRMTKIFKKNKNEFYDDYAHHPTEIISVLKGVRQVSNNRKIITVFQPHRYSRLRALKDEFIKSFIYADIVLLCPVYAAGEKKDTSYNFISFANKIAKKSNVQVIFVKNSQELKNYLKRNLIDDEIVIGMGAGNISNWMRELKNNI
tara:strand:- start:992 stop:2389 length:1398 start_codon:yes stop_codon:yes gene_type:complete